MPYGYLSHPWLQLKMSYGVLFLCFALTWWSTWVVCLNFSPQILHAYCFSSECDFWCCLNSCLSLVSYLLQSHLYFTPVCVLILSSSWNFYHTWHGHIWSSLFSCVWSSIQLIHWQSEILDCRYHRHKASCCDCIYAVWVNGGYCIPFGRCHTVWTDGIPCGAHLFSVLTFIQHHKLHKYIFIVLDFYVLNHISLWWIFPWEICLSLHPLWFQCLFRTLQCYHHCHVFPFFLVQFLLQGLVLVVLLLALVQHSYSVLVPGHLCFHPCLRARDLLPLQSLYSHWSRSYLYWWFDWPCFVFYKASCLDGWSCLRVSLLGNFT